MIGLVLVTHGNLGAEFIKVLEHIVGAQKNIVAVAIDADDDMEKKRLEILDKITATDTGSGVILLTDMFGGTPSNLAISLTQEGKVEALAGLNVPMLVKLASVRSIEPVGKAVISGQDAGRKYINAASALLKDVANG